MVQLAVAVATGHARPRHRASRGSWASARDLPHGRRARGPPRRTADGPVTAGSPFSRVAAWPASSAVSSTALGCGLESAPIVVARVRACRHRPGDDPAARGPQPPTCIRPRDAPAASPMCSSARSSARRSARSSSGRSSPARSSTRTRSIVPWLAAGGIMVIGLVLVLMVRPDPQTIARQLHFDAGGSRR